ncbi:MAG: Calx-beta domain-containing protein [Actinomycetota bacterium]
MAVPLLPGMARAAVLTVTTTADSGTGSLRQAITDANSDPDLDVIEFSIGSGEKTISPATPLPDITAPVTIDGTSQPGFAGKPVVELDGAAADAPGITIMASDSTIKGLVVNRFPGHGILIIGGGDPNAPVENNTVIGNFIGTDLAGTADRGNDAFGVSIENSDGNTVGGTGAGDGNLISGNGRAGIRISEASSDNLVEGNLIGTDLTGSAPLGSASAGIRVEGSDNYLGGAAVGGGNVIMFNGGDGIAIPQGSKNEIRSNQIRANGGLGIDLGENGVLANDPGDSDSGANAGQNYPVLTGAFISGSGTTVEGSLNSRPDATFTLEFFSTPNCDGSGHGEGKVPLGTEMVTTDSDGDVAFSIVVPTAATKGHRITSTATSSQDNTSEFSNCVVTAGPEGALRFSASNYTADEDGGSKTIAVTRVGGTSGAVSVEFETTGGSATPNSDYQPASGVLNFSDGETEETFGIAIINDSRFEPDETVGLRLSNPTGGAVLGTPRQATLRIRDDDCPPLSDFFAYSPSFAGGVFVATGDVNGDGCTDLITGAGAGGGPHVKVFHANGALLAQGFAYHPFFTGGVTVAAGDIDLDGRAEVITGAGPGGGPHVKVFDVAGGELRVRNSFFAYAPSFAGGVFVGAGDVRGPDDRAEVVTGPGAGGGPHVRVFRAGGGLMAQAMVYSTAFTGGVRVGSAEVDGGTRAEIVTGAGPGGGPHVKIFDLVGSAFSLKASFFAYAPSFAGGVFVGGGEVIPSSARQEVVTGPGAGGGPNVKVFRGDGATLASFFGYSVGFTGGVTVAAGDSDGDGNGEVVTGAGPGGGPHVRQFE